MKLRIDWKASEKLLRDEVIAHGKASNPHREFDVDFETLTSEERAALLALTSIYSDTAPEVRVYGITLQSIPATTTAWPSYGSPCVDMEFDAQPTVAEIVMTQTATKSRAAELKAASEAKKKEKEVEKARVAAVIADMENQIEALAESEDGLRALVLPDLAADELHNLRMTIKNKLDAIANARQSKAQVIWIAEHGSERLRRAAARGYNVKRLYVVERAAMEAPGFVVDFDNMAAWKDRSSPSAHALTKESAAVGLGAARIVWLTDAPQAEVEAEDDGEEGFEPCEAIVLRDYLGKYDLVQII